MNFDELCQTVVETSTTVKHIDEQMKLMATKDEVLDVHKLATEAHALAQESHFNTSKIHWVITALLSAITFLVGKFFPWQ